MSNYKLTPSVDVSSSSVTGQINLFNTGGTFAVQLKAPALAASVPFVLPATAGSTGQFLNYGAAAPTWAAITRTNVSMPINITFIVAGTGVTIAAAFTDIGTIHFLGTTVEGTPSAIYAVVGGFVATGVRVRIVDSTFGPIIGTSTAVATTAVPQIVSIPVGTINAAAAIWTVRLESTGATTAQLWSLHVLP